MFKLTDNMREVYTKLKVELDDIKRVHLRTQWRTQPGDGSDGGFGGVDVQTRRGRGRPRRGERRAAATHAASNDLRWEVESIVAARRTPTCVGSWEYLVQWGGVQEDGTRWEATWEAEAQLELSNAMRDEVACARGADRCRAATFGEWLDTQVKRGDARCVGVRRRCEGSDGVATRGVTANATWAHTWKLFTEYAIEVRGDTHIHNLEELPARVGRCGGSWKCTDHVQTSYIGEYKEFKDAEGVVTKRRIMSLATGTDEDKRIPAQLRVTMNTIRTRLEEEERWIAEGKDDTALPPYYPKHAIDSVGNRLGLFLGTGTGSPGYDLIRDSELLADPITRLFLRSDELESGTGAVPLSNGRVARMDRRERRIMQERKSTSVSADAARIAIALHFRHHFTHAAAVDGSKVGEKEEEGHSRCLTHVGAVETLTASSSRATLKRTKYKKG